jgi:hypothetical protein
VAIVVGSYAVGVARRRGPVDGFMLPKNWLSPVYFNDQASLIAALQGEQGDTTF